MTYKSYKNQVVQIIRTRAVKTATGLGSELRQAALPVTPILTGDLRRSSASKIVEQKSGVVSRVSSTVSYARKQYFTNARLPRWYETAIAYDKSRLDVIFFRGMRL
ncbi:HK97 gp10 family phage protein [Listeria aquatica]|uniref:HK97 gp10 family phage protein n=1 Tax=Listeria aquatica TaxID=1494960 RepID=A0A841ZPZ8_9LIST|nr:HK97 gp10 family phage protein [Listeria aquatica]MBC1521404.1 HK97 gp10 family phage protein [Listeria aquatica]